MTIESKRGGKREGAGRKPLPEKMVMWYLRVPPDLMDKLKTIPRPTIRAALEKLTK